MGEVKLTKRPKGYIDETRFGILNPWGDVWSSETFTTEDAARAYINAFWRNVKDPGDLSRFRVVRVRTHVTVPSALQDQKAPGDTP